MMSEGGVVALEITDSDPPPPPYDEEKPAATTFESEEPPERKKRQWLGYAGNALLITAIGLFLIVFIPLYLLYAGAAWLFCNIDVTDEHNSVEQNVLQGKKSFFDKVHEVQETTRKIGKLPRVIQSRLVIFVLTWLTVNLSVPELRNKFVLGSKLWKWTLLFTVVSCGYHLISMMTQSLIFLLCLNPQLKSKNNWVYYIQGLRQSVNLVILSAAILLTWVLYFRTDRGIKKTDDTDTVLHVCTWSFVTLAVTAVLWLLKSVLLLKWEADAVYCRFKERILTAGLQIYFLGHICGWHLGVFQPKSEDNRENINDDNQTGAQDLDQAEEAQIVEETSSTTDGKADKDKVKDKVDKENRNEEKKKAKEIFRLDKSATINDIQKMTEYFVDLFKVSSREDDGTSDVLNQCKKMDEENAPDKYIKVKDLEETFELDSEDANTLFKRLKQEHNTTNISYRNFEKSMVRAQNNCVALGHTLMDAKEVVGVLNNVMVGLLFVIVFIAWLLLTDIATTKILVLIASPLLAITFVFGDTCKKIFEGIIFSFINHPFDVGDRCIIDKIEFEVRRMSVLTTTFVIIGTKEEALYPNSALATIPIINLKGEPDPSDYVELTLDSNHTKSMVVELHENINKLFEDDRGKKFEKAHSIVVKEIGDTVKMEIQYDHVMSINEMTHSQCLKKKRQQKSELLLQIKQLIEEINKKNKSSTIGNEVKVLFVFPFSNRLFLYEVLHAFTYYLVDGRQLRDFMHCL
ncbi:hypothetical protein V2J09_004566 [Rumex salicifolius]